MKTRNYCHAIDWTRSLVIGGAVAMLAADPRVSLAVVKNWNAGIGNWTAGANWTPAGVPAAADVVNIGAHAAAENSVVSLPINNSAAALAITDGMTLRTLTGSLAVNGSTQISGQNIDGLTTYSSRLRVENGVAPHDFSTIGLTASQFAQISLEDDAAMIVSGVASLGVDTQLTGRGTVTFTGGGVRALINDGLIAAGLDGLTLVQSGVGKFDLDGDSGDGQLIAEITGGATLRFIGTELSDAFSGNITIGPNSLLDMDFANGWTADSSSSITVTAAAAMLPPAYLDGGDVILAGDVSVTEVDGRMRILANATLNPTFGVTIGAGGQLAFDDEAQVNGGDFNVGSGGLLSFWGETAVEGGAFTTAGTGQVSFNGLTTWNGVAFFNGRAEQNGDAAVSGATTINADEFDMDGSAASPAEWEVNAGLVINADQIGATAANNFSGAFNIGGGLFNRLTVNLTDPSDAWVMSGEMNFAGVAGLYFTRVAGARMLVTGELNVSDSNIDIAAPVTLADVSIINFAAPGSDLRLSGPSEIYSNATFNGQGLLQNNSDGMLLADGASLGQVGLVNGGDLSLGSEVPGQAFVDRFTNEDDGTFHVEIGGTTPGTELTQLFVTGGTAQLAGTLALSLVNNGGSLFAPELGDQFTILTAAGGVVGQFDALLQPLGMSTSLLFEIQYTANSVVLYVDSTYAADFDRDGDVDGHDLPHWQNAFDGHNGGDADDDGDSDGADFLVWQRQLGLGLPMAEAYAVPEPAAARIAGAAGAAIAFFATYRRRNSYARRSAGVEWAASRDTP